jgi:hypothetical protein
LISLLLFLPFLFLSFVFHSFLFPFYSFSFFLSLFLYFFPSFIPISSLTIASTLFFSIITVNINLSHFKLNWNLKNSSLNIFKYFLTYSSLCVQKVRRLIYLYNYYRYKYKLVGLNLRERER